MHTKWRKRRGSTFTVSAGSPICRRTDRRMDGRPRGRIDTRSPFLRPLLTPWDLSSLYDEEIQQNIVKITIHTYTFNAFTYCINHNNDKARVVCMCGSLWPLTHLNWAIYPFGSVGRYVTTLLDGPINSWHAIKLYLLHYIRDILEVD